MAVAFVLVLAGVATAVPAAADGLEVAVPVMMLVVTA